MIGNLQPMPPLPDDAYCGWCGKPKPQCAVLIAGPMANICDECVELCNDVLARTPAADCPESPIHPASDRASVAGQHKSDK